MLHMLLYWLLSKTPPCTNMNGHETRNRVNFLLISVEICRKTTNWILLQCAKFHFYFILLCKPLAEKEVVLGKAGKLQCVDMFCYLDDMLGCGGGAGDVVKSRVRCA